MLVNFKSVSLAILEQLAFNAQKFTGVSSYFQKFRGHVTLATPPFRKNFQGSCPDCLGNMSAKFEVRSFECVGSRQRLSVTTQNRWTQVRGPEHSRRQSLI